jgi:hypothetical protein
LWAAAAALVAALARLDGAATTTSAPPSHQPFPRSLSPPPSPLPSPSHRNYSLKDRLIAKFNNKTMH